MNNLTIFWNDKNTDYFYWCCDESLSSDNTNSVNLLESRKILKADIACIADMTEKSRVTLVLASTDVYFDQVNLPNKAQRHLRKAVPFLLEEQIAEPVDELFIAVGNRLDNDNIPVRAINTTYFQSLLDTFKNAEIKLNRVCVDLDLLAAATTGYQVMLIDERVLFVDDKQQRFNCHIDDFSWVIEKQLAVNSDEEEMPVAIPMNILCESEEIYQLFKQQLPIGRFAPQESIIQELEEELSKNQNSAINLLQGDFEVKSESSVLKKILFKVASIFAIVLGVFIFYQGSQIAALSSQKTALTKQRNVFWKQAFPNRRVPANPDKELRSFLMNIGGSSNGDGFLSLLQKTSIEINNLEKIYPTNISYNGSRNEIRIDIVAKDLPELNAYRDKLKSIGFEIDMSSATQRGDGYSTRLIIRSQ